MHSSFQSDLRLLAKTVNRFDAGSNERKRLLLKSLSQKKLPHHSSLLKYYDLLLFIIAFPADTIIMSLAEQELARISAFLKASSAKQRSTFTNSGLPFTEYVSSFSHDCVKWLLGHPDCKTQVEKFNDPDVDINDVLSVVLPSLLRSETTAGYTADELFDALLIKKDKRLPFLINEFGKLDSLPYVKDLLYDLLSLYLRITPRSRRFSRAYNRVSSDTVFFHDGLQKNFDHKQLLETGVGPAESLPDKRKKEIIRVIKNSLALTDRETDTVTYMDENSLRYYNLGRNISVALYGMIPERQLPLESYVGYTLFRNGFPAAYGGGWVFGSRSDFGINIFEPFRGGESGYMLCQLLRLYRQVFGISFFEVEPFQFGAHNKEGIESGAFWFYYRYGFRPVDRKLQEMAADEWRKITGSKKYFTEKKKLERLATGNLVLNLGTKIPAGVNDITNRVKQMIARKYKNDTIAAGDDSIKKFIVMVGLENYFRPEKKNVLAEVSLWANAYSINDTEKLKLMSRIVSAKAVDLYRYQELLLNFFGS